MLGKCANGSARREGSRCNRPRRKAPLNTYHATLPSSLFLFSPGRRRRFDSNWVLGNFEAGKRTFPARFAVDSISPRPSFPSSSSTFLYVSTSKQQPYTTSLRSSAFATPRTCFARWLFRASTTIRTRSFMYKLKSCYTHGDQCSPFLPSGPDSDGTSVDCSRGVPTTLDVEEVVGCSPMSTDDGDSLRCSCVSVRGEEILTRICARSVRGVCFLCDRARRLAPGSAGSSTSDC